VNPALDPTIDERLRALHRRWRRLVLLRGTAALLAALGGGALLLALVDRLVVTADGWRLGSGLALYALALFAGWWWGGRFLLQHPDARRLAQLAERADPHLREQLLPAVELAQAGERWDSPVFRRLTQQAAAAQLATVPDERVLPRRLVLGWLIAGTGVIAVCTALVLAPGWRFDRTFLRVTAPLADVERVSRVQVTWLAPTVAETVLPRGDSLPVTIRVSDPALTTAVLEVFRAGRLDERQRMMAAEDGRFTGTVLADEPHLEFRVRTGDALTRRLTVITHARPEVKLFTRRYTYPAYTGLPAREERGEDGHIAALTGTQVRLEIEGDQALRDAALEILGGSAPTILRLERVDDHRFAVSFPLNANGTYRVRVIAAATGIENNLSPEYELRAEPDLNPRIDLLEPGRDLLLPPDETVTLVGAAEDDFGLARTALEARVNDGEWREIASAPATNRTATARHALALDTLELKAGDVVNARLVAEDLKGNRSETPAVAIKIHSAGLDTARLAALEARTELHKRLAELASLARTLTVTNPAARAGLAGRLGELTPLLDEARSQLAALLPRMRAGREAATLAHLGNLLARLEHSLLPRAQLEAGPANTNAPVALPQLRRLAESLERDHASLLVAEQLDVAAETLQDLANTAARAARRATNDPAAAPRALAAFSREAKGIEERWKQLQIALPKQSAGRVASAARSLAAARAEAERSRKLESATKGLNAAAAELRAARVDAAREAEQAWKRLPTGGGPVDAPFTELIAPIERGAPASGPQQKLAWNALAQWVEAQAQLDEARADADSEFVADLGRLHTALETLQTDGPSDRATLIATLRELAVAHGQLVAARDFGNLLTGLRATANEERWELSSLLTHTARPRDWRWAKAWLEAPPAAWNSLPGGEVLVTQLRQAAASEPALTVHREMDQRLTRGAPPTGRHAELEALLEWLETAGQPLLAAAARARETIRAAAPALSERLEQLAAASRALEARTADDVLRDEQQSASPEIREELGRVLAAQEEFVEKVDRLREALRREANAQDLMTAAGRERARDADVAGEMLREPPRNAAAHLRQAVAATNERATTQNLDQANAEQQRTTRALDQLAAHWRQMEQGGDVAKSRAALRQAEAALGLKDQLDQRYAQAEQTAELAEMSPEEQLAALEKELTANEAMRAELSAIAREAFEAGARALQAAAQEQTALADRLGSTATRQNRQGEAAQAAHRSAMEALRVFTQNELPENTRAAQALGESVSRPVADAVARLNAAAALRGEDAAAAQTVARRLEEARAALADAAKAADTAVRNSGNADSARAAQATLQQAQQRVARLAQQAQQAAGALAQLADATARALTDADTSQAAVNERAEQAANVVQRGARHEARLNPAKAFEMLNVGLTVDSLARATLPEARRNMAAADSPGAAESTARAAREAIEGALRVVKSALGQAGDEGQPQARGNNDPNAKRQAQAKARALDQLDSQMNQGKRASPNSPQSTAQKTSRMLSQAQQEATRAARNQPPSDAEAQSAEGYYSAAGKASGALPQLPGATGGDWGRLRAQMARDVSEGRRDTPGGEYRAMIDTYFRVVAEQARKAER
jgi:hypothetical protein